jgi:hypothetical protein
MPQKVPQKGSEADEALKNQCNLKVACFFRKHTRKPKTTLFKLVQA